jgi:hypothetical protein
MLIKFSTFAPIMNRPSKISKQFLCRKVATLVLLTASVAAFATLGDGGKKGNPDNTPVFLPYNAKNFSLRSNYNYQSNNLLNMPEKKEFIMLSPVITNQKGNSTYVLPLKKIPLMGKIKFTSTPQNY